MMEKARVGSAARVRGPAVPSSMMVWAVPGASAMGWGPRAGRLAVVAAGAGMTPSLESYAAGWPLAVIQAGRAPVPKAGMMSLLRGVPRWGAVMSRVPPGLRVMLGMVTVEEAD